MSTPDQNIDPDVQREAMEAMQRRQQEYQNELMQNFALKLGQSELQGVADKTQFDNERRDWQQEREHYMKLVIELQERIAALEGEPLDPEEPATESLEAEDATDEDLEPPKDIKTASKKRR